MTSFDKSKKERRIVQENEWACPEPKCGGVNPNYRNQCALCGKSKPRQRAAGAQLIGKEQAEKSKGLFAAEDWACTKCGNVNWARRNQCNMCNAPKIAEEAPRTGYGGGYMDRQEVEYKSKDEIRMEEQVDDFGRVIKKKRPNDLNETVELESDEGEVVEIEETINKEEPEVSSSKVEEQKTDVKDSPIDDESNEEEGDEDDEELAKKYGFDDFDIMPIMKTAIASKDFDTNGLSDCSCSCSGGSCSCSPSPSPEPTPKLERKKRSHSKDRDRGQRRDRSSHSYRSSSRDRRRRSRERHTSRDRYRRSHSRDRHRW